MKKFPNSSSKRPDDFDNLYYNFGERLKGLIAKSGKAHKEIEEACGLSAKRLSKLIESVAPGPNIYELKKLSEFFKISCDELVIGIRPENQYLEERSIFDIDTVNCLRDVQKESPDYIKVMDIFFRKENNDMRTLLFDSFLLYANREMFNISLGKLENGFPFFLSRESLIQVSKSIALNYLNIVLEKFRNDWIPTLDKRIDSFTQEQLRDMVRRLEASSKQVEDELEEEYLRDVSDDDIS